MKLAAIDIGSNAIRCQISSVLCVNENIIFKRVEYIRYAIRFGEDVFQSGVISKRKQQKFFKLMHALKLLIDVHDVDHYMICATSAMREAKNAPELIGMIKDELNMKIEVIDGEREAELINTVIRNVLSEKNYLHIDVGGGSTEFNVYVNKQKVDSRSFELGSIRHLQGSDSEETWQQMQKWVEANARKYHMTRAIGTGGNINKIYDLAGKANSKPIFKKQIEEIVEQLDKMTMEDRINVLLLNPDRADVIVPAAQIYLSAMKWAKIESMLVPAVGLKDGMMHALYEKHKPKNQVVRSMQDSNLTAMS